MMTVSIGIKMMWLLSLILVEAHLANLMTGLEMEGCSQLENCTIVLRHQDVNCLMVSVQSINMNIKKSLGENCSL